MERRKLRTAHGNHIHAHDGQVHSKNEGGINSHHLKLHPHENGIHHHLKTHDGQYVAVHSDGAVRTQPNPDHNTTVQVQSIPEAQAASAAAGSAISAATSSVERLRQACPLKV